MASMSPPASSEAPTPVKKPRGRPAGGGPGKKKATAAAGKDGDTPRGTGSGRGRKKRQSTVDSHGASTPSAGPGSGGLSMHTPGGNSSSYPSPGIAGIASMLEDEANRGGNRDREGSQFSAGRKSTVAGARGARGETGTQADGEADEEEDEEDDDDDEDLNFGDDAYDEQAKERAEAKEALRMLLDQFGPEQLERYETYRRSGLPNGSIKKLVNHVLQQSCTPSIILAVRGLSKVFVGEIVEMARQVQADANETGPLTPDHLREAYARYKSVRDKRGSNRAKLFVR